jgi:hypothetical protein
MECKVGDELHIIYKKLCEAECNAIIFVSKYMVSLNVDMFWKKSVGQIHSAVAYANEAG